MFYCHYNFEMIYLWFKNYLKCVNTFLIIFILARWSKSWKFWTIKTCRHSLWTTMIQSGFQRLYKVIYWVNMFYSCPSFGQNSFTTLLFFPTTGCQRRCFQLSPKRNVKTSSHANVVNKLYETQNKNSASPNEDMHITKRTFWPYI